MVASLAALAALAWVTFLLVTPLLPAWAGAGLYGLGSLICHQIPERSFYTAGFQLPVCARCLGIYIGVAGGAALLSVRVRRPLPMVSRLVRRLAVVAALPTIVTMALETVGIWFPSNLTRAIAGLPLGALVGVVVANALREASVPAIDSRPWGPKQGRAARGAGPTLHYDECAPPRPTVPKPPPPSI